MKKVKVNRTYHATDVYHKWKKQVAEAKQSITIFTPFFDNLLVNLLKQTDLGKMQITIVTDLNPASLLEQPKQLKTLKSLLSNGFNVLNAPRLHAKVLLTDDTYVAVGSQNFTSYARNSKECTSLPDIPFEDSKFVKTLLKWRHEAQPIDEAFVDILLSELSSQFTEFKKLLKNTEEQFALLQEGYEEHKRQSLLRRLKEMEKQSSIKLAQGKAYAYVDLLHGDSGYYYSLVAKQGNDLTHWIANNSDGEKQPYKLKRLTMYPFIVADSGVMGFARIAKTRITYFRNEVRWSNQWLDVKGQRVEVTISFPEKNTEKYNVKVTLKHNYLGSCDAFFLFTGDDFELVETKFTEHRNDEEKAFEDNLNVNFFTVQDELDKFFNRFIRSFTFKVLNIGNKNVCDYLKSSNYRLSVIEYQRSPILVIKQVNY